MNNLSDTLDGLLVKTERLIKSNESLRDENNRLFSINKQMKESLEEQVKELEGLEEKYRVINLAKSFSGDNEKSLDAKQKINEFVREIDKCIALLSV